MTNLLEKDDPTVQQRTPSRPPEQPRWHRTADLVPPRIGRRALQLWITRRPVADPRHDVVMSYHDLPEDIRTRPLSEPILQGNVVDLVLGIEERRSAAVALMLCDQQDRGLQPIVLTDLPEDAAVEELERLLDLVLPVVGEMQGSILVGRGRRRGLLPTDLDRAWHQATIQACARHGVRLLGFHLASPDGVAALPPPLRDAS